MRFASSSCSYLSFLALFWVVSIPATITSAQKPVIFDTDYGPFIDDIFALGLLVNSGDLLDLRMVLTTSEDPSLSGQCVAKHLDRAGRSDIPVAIGSTFPPYEERASVCGIPGLVGFALEAECSDYVVNVTTSASVNRQGISGGGDDDPPIVMGNGVDAMAQMIMDSDRDDWWYIVVGGQTSFRDFLQQYPDAAAKIDTLIVMAGNWCADFYPYPDVLAPTDETNIGCDPAAANDVLDASLNPIRNIYYVPVVVADEIAGDDYLKFVEAATGDPADAGAAATLDFYQAWSAAGRANPDLLVHAEANKYDPETESTPMFDPCAIMLAIELLDDCEDRLALFEFDSVHFLEAGEGETDTSPRAAFSLHTGNEDLVLPEQCPALTNFTFEADETPEQEIPVKIALGYKSSEAKASFYAEMALRMAGRPIAACNGNATTGAGADGDSSQDEPEQDNDTASTSSKSFGFGSGVALTVAAAILLH